MFEKRQDRSVVSVEPVGVRRRGAYKTFTQALLDTSTWSASCDT
jgi:hypothetical protein